MSDDQTKEIQRLKETIRRARSAFCHDESDHKAAVRMLEILDPECDTHKLEIEYQIQYLNHASTWQIGICCEDPEEAVEKLDIVSKMNPGGKYRLVRRELREEVLKVK